MILAAVLLASTLAAEQGENMYRDAKVGDWVEYKGGDVVSRHTVTSKTADLLILKIDQTVGGKAGPPIEQRIDLTKPYPPPRTPEDKTDATTTVEKLGEGKETLTIGGTKYECEWLQQKTTITPKEGKPVVVVSKVWKSKDVPLGGAVRTESEVDGKTYTTEIAGFARGK